MATSATVLLPVLHAGDTLRRAFGSLASQTLEDLEILLILNGSDERTRAVADEIRREDGRVRVIERDRPGLAGALNEGLGAARHALVARMDADDTCAAERLELQASFLVSHPEVLAVGCGWDVVGADGRTVTTMRPPEDPDEVRWRLLLSNVFAHGSMMMRRDAVVAAGGYDERLERAQDYDLWLRLSERGALCALPQVLYSYTLPHDGQAHCSSRVQAQTAGRLLASRWRSLPGAGGDLDEDLAAALATDQGLGDARAMIESRLTNDGPTREGLLAWLWASWLHPPMDGERYDTLRLSRVREVGREMREAGVASIWLWGAGNHTRWLLEHVEELGVEVVGLVDDLVSESRFGLDVVRPEQLEATDVVLLSSDWHEDELWEASAGHRGRGGDVWRLYVPRCRDRQGHEIH